MDFQDTPLEARSIARQVARGLRKSGFGIAIEKAIANDAPLRTTLLAKKGTLHRLVEAQAQMRVDSVLIGLARWLGSRGQYAELFVASDSDAQLTGRTVRQCRDEGIGILTVHDDGRLDVVLPARNFALVVNLDPNLRLGNKRTAVDRAIGDFNSGERKSGVRDICEMVEKETDAIALKAVDKGWLVKHRDQVERMSWSRQIEMLASQSSYVVDKEPMLDPVLARDLQALRDARNLFDHKVRTAAKEKKRDLQAKEKMLQGPRLLSELLGIKRRIR
ncbi:MAG: hypothetical protein IIA64_01055 [Planctomycetes bacterium]|nr:hypothetical protein [Planctomycetota bacterium]